ncbi:class I SAM-dependent methyltransferase [Pseudonocardia parietis]|uniref:SAM-dependent methyltransferase n=1 Tax=Pseudonocardia parietis TaxID=570936 RepID=A0ABS4VL87_9PSEU|nr:class I SAM-dependent methyltransferase [Pseudonocardia parietis]MBP2364685.1 SAM-dependent methyltransferase [Pseudonocardia parietis]
MSSSRPANELRRRLRFPGTEAYWDRRYEAGGTSGAGSYGPQAEWKASIVNGWVDALGVRSVVDLGCGDGNQLSLAHYPRYLGLDLSAEAVRMCIRRYGDDPTKSFLAYDPSSTSDAAGWLCADLALSMEVLFHLVDDGMFEDYLARLFDSAERYVVICSSDTSDIPQGPHERHRPFTPWISANRSDWVLEQRADPPEDMAIVSSLYLYRRV